MKTNEAVVLPIQPSITPGMGIAGALLIITGLAYTLIGIKHKWYAKEYTIRQHHTNDCRLQIFLSMAYLTSLSVSVSGSIIWLGVLY